MVLAVLVGLSRAIVIAIATWRAPRPVPLRLAMVSLVGGAAAMAAPISATVAPSWLASADAPSWFTAADASAAARDPARRRRAARCRRRAVDAGVLRRCATVRAVVQEKAELLARRHGGSPHRARPLTRADGATVVDLRSTVAGRVAGRCGQPSTHAGDYRALVWVDADGIIRWVEPMALTSASPAPAPAPHPSVVPRSTGRATAASR